MASKNISKSALMGFIWEVGTKAVMQLLSWISTIYVANLLNPSDYTYLLISGVYLTVFVVVAGMGISSGIVTTKKVTSHQINSLFWLLLASGVLVYLSFYAISPFIEDIYNMESLKDVLRVSGLMIIISNCGIVPYAILLRKLRFKFIAITDMFSKLILIVVSILMAYNGYQYWSLVVSVVVSQAVSAVLFYAGAKFRPKTCFEYNSVQPLVRTSSRYFLVNLTRYLNNNSVPFVISFLISPAQVGIFQMAYTIATIPLLKIGEIFDHVTFPAISALKGDALKAKKMYLNLHKGLMGLAMPMYAGIYFVSDDLVKVVLEPKWYDLVPVLKILCVINLLRMSLQLVPRVVEGLGMPNISLRILLAMATLMPLGVLFGNYWGYIGSYIGWLIMMPIIYLYAINLINRVVSSNLVETIETIYPSFLSTVIMCVFILLIDYSYLSVAWSDVWVLTLKVSVGVMTYSLIYLSFFRKDFIQIKKLYSA